MKNTGGRRTRWVGWVAVVIFLALGAAACSDVDDSATTAASDSGTADFAADEPARALAEEEAFAEEEAPAEEPEERLSADLAEGDAQASADDEVSLNQGGGGESVQGGDGPVPNIGRSIIFVANVEVEVDDVLLSTRQAKTAIAGLGGLVFGEETFVGSTTTTTLEFKVFPEDFEEALDRLEGLGKLKSQQISADDVTERVVDLQSRISTAEISVDRLRGFLEGATELKDIAELESQLLGRETDLERLRGSLRTIQDQVSLATIFLTLREAAPPAIEALGEFNVTFYEGDDQGARCPGTDDLRVDEGDHYTLCVEITNVGTNAIGDIEVRDHGLDLSPRDFAFIDDAGTDPLEPGQTIFAWASGEAPAFGGSGIQVNADVLDDDGEPLRIGVDFFRPEDSTIRFVEDDSLPGFLDALKGSWDTLVVVVSIAFLIVAGFLPFVWVPVVIWAGRRWWLARQAKKAEALRASQAEQKGQPSSLPPPAPVDAAKDD